MNPNKNSDTDLLRRCDTATALSPEAAVPAGRKGAVRVRSRMKYAGSRDTIATEGRGRCVAEGTALTLVYAERTPEGDTAQCRLTLCDGGAVLHRRGTVSSTLRFEPDTTTDMVCTTPYGEMRLRLRTLRCEVRATADSLAVRLGYELLEAGSVVSENSLYIVFYAD